MNFAFYHTWHFVDRVEIAPGVPVIDLLNGVQCPIYLVGGVEDENPSPKVLNEANDRYLRLAAEMDARSKLLVDLERELASLEGERNEQ